MTLAAAALAMAARAGGVHETRPGGPVVHALTLPRHPRVLVFAPHPDDETLGAGGLIARLVRQHVPVRVVVVTNGDGWPWAVQADFDEKKPTDEDYVAFGQLRQREAYAAAHRLGLRRRDMLFLGFPDGGLTELWRAHWPRTHPYTSPFTKEDSPPYAGAVNPDVDYDGQELTSVIARILRDFRPSVVVMPHPYDGHPDHSATSFFVTEAVDGVQARHDLPPGVTVLTYLIHDPLWPPAAREKFDRLPPPRGAHVPDTLWEDTDLTPTELATKEGALREYRSQLEASPNLLRRFLRRNELYGRVKSQVFARIAAVH